MNQVIDGRVPLV